MIKRLGNMRLSDKNVLIQNIRLVGKYIDCLRTLSVKLYSLKATIAITVCLSLGLFVSCNFLKKKYSQLLFQNPLHGLIWSICSIDFPIPVDYYCTLSGACVAQR